MTKESADVFVEVGGVPDEVVPEEVAPDEVVPEDVVAGELVVDEVLPVDDTVASVVPDSLPEVQEVSSNAASPTAMMRCHTVFFAFNNEVIG